MKALEYLFCFVFFFFHNVLVRLTGLPLFGDLTTYEEFISKQVNAVSDSYIFIFYVSTL